MHLEEKLYLVEVLISSFNFYNSYMFARCVTILLNFSNDGEEVSPYGNLKNDYNPNKM